MVFGDPILPPPESEASEQAYEKLTADLKARVVEMWEGQNKKLSSGQSRARSSVSWSSDIRSIYGNVILTVRLWRELVWWILLYVARNVVGCLGHVCALRLGQSARTFDHRRVP